MKFVKTVDMWSLDEQEMRRLKPGQWVKVEDQMGRFYGIKESGTVVVAWLNNARRSGNCRTYNRTLYDYAKNG